jgi:hydrogenase/urease accessory protein HupE
MRRRGVRASLLAALATLLAIEPASAHTGGSTGFATIVVSGNAVRYSLTLSPAGLRAPVVAMVQRARAGGSDAGDELVALLREKISLTAGGTRCAPAGGQLLPPSPDVESVTMFVDFACPRDAHLLVIRDDVFDTLGSDHHTLARIDVTGRIHQFAFEATIRETTVTVGEVTGASRGMASFLLLGVHHILSGWDHLLFLLALMLRGGSLLALLKIVTAFTLAHSVTLGMAVLGLVTVPERLVESVIAASIAYVALENLLLRGAPSRRWLVSFGFGLVHGFGFAAALDPLELPRAGLAMALLTFNLGVEVGQAAVILVALPVLLWSRRRAWEPGLVRVASAALVVVGVAVLVQRLLP